MDWASASIRAALSAMAISLGVNGGDVIAERVDAAPDRSGVQGALEHPRAACGEMDLDRTTCGDEARDPVGVLRVALDIVSKRGGR